jgi:hypothetical protein
MLGLVQPEVGEEGIAFCFTKTQRILHVGICGKGHGENILGSLRPLVEHDMAEVTAVASDSCGDCLRNRLTPAVRSKCGLCSTGVMLLSM